jgi:hypothetical protein
MLGAADLEVEVHFDVHVREPAAAFVGGQADLVVSRVVAGEGETPIRRSEGVDDSVAGGQFLESVGGLRWESSRSRQVTEASHSCERDDRAREERKRECVQEGVKDTYLDCDLDAHVLVLCPRVRRLIPQQCAIMA